MQPQMGMQMGQDRSSDLPELFGAWGVAYDRTATRGRPRPRDLRAVPGPATGDRALRRLAQRGRRADGPRRPGHGQPEPAQHRDRRGPSRSPTTPRVTLEPLIDDDRPVGGSCRSTSVQRFPDPASLLNDFFPDGETRVVAARLTGTPATAFPDGPPGADRGRPSRRRATTTGGGRRGRHPPRPGPPRSRRPSPSTSSSSPTRTCSRTGAGSASSAWAGAAGLRRLADNGAFAVNAAEQMAGDRPAALRGRGSFSRPFTLLEEMAARGGGRVGARVATLEEEMQQASRGSASC
jgi:hypothetical protein